MPTRPARKGLPCAIAVLATGLALVCPPPGASAKEDEQTTRSATDLARALASSFAHVEVALRYDEGQPPATLTGGWQEGYAGLVTQERPLDLTGLVLAPDRVLVSDPQIPPRFVAGITVVFGTQRVPAKPFAWAVQRRPRSSRSSAPSRARSR
jgi:hypothetical protein